MDGGEAEETVGGGGGAEDPCADCGGGGGSELDDAAEGAAIGSVKATDTKLLWLELRRRL